MKFCTSIAGGFALLFSATALFAAAPWTGSGTANDPYLVGTPQDLKAIALQVNAGNYADSAFKLTADINLDSTVQGEFTAIGTDKKPFLGNFDGDSHIISNLYINQPDSFFQGLFGYAQNADIRNTGLDSAWVIGHWYVGGLIGEAKNSSVSNVYATGSVTGRVSISTCVGGLIGSAFGGMVTNAYATGSVSGDKNGGLIGWAANGTTVTNAYATGSVSGEETVGGLIGGASSVTVTKAYAMGSVSGSSDVGGLIGWAEGESSVTDAYATGRVSGEYYIGGLIGWAENGPTVTNAYATGRVSGDKNVGGLIGNAYESSVTNAYATGRVSGNKSVGGLIGWAGSGTTTNAYWDKESTGQNASAGGVGKTTAELKTPRFARTLGMNAWRWDEIQKLNKGYPVLVSQGGTVVLWDGNGTQSDPFQIANAEDLKAVSAQVNAGNYADSCFKLTADIDLDSTVQGEFTAIGTDTTRFQGVFDGGSHIISNLYINQPASYFQGLFGYADNADIRNIGLNSAWVIGKGNVGGLIGNAHNSFVTNAYATGHVSGLDLVGGLIGTAEKSSVTSIYATGSVSGTGWSVGGLIGGAYDGTTATNAYATGSVSGTASVGGLIGTASGTVTNAYATGHVSGSDLVGGLIGWAVKVTVTNAYWDKESTGQSTSAGGGEGKTTAELKNHQFAKTLGISAWRWDKTQKLNKGYPVLVSQGGVIPPEPTAPSQHAVVGESVEVKGSDFGTLGGDPVTIDKKTAFLATYIPPFKTNAKPKKLSVKLDKTTLGSPVQELDIKGFVSLLNTKLYKQQLKTPKTTREILLADSVAHKIQLEGLLVNIVVKGKKNAVSSGSVTLMMVPPAIDSVVVVTVDSGSRKETLYAVTAVQDLGTKAKGRLETVQNSKVKKTSVSFVKERKWSSISEISHTVSNLEILYPDASVSVLKLPKKFKTLTSPDLVIDNRNGLNAVAMPK